MIKSFKHKGLENYFYTGSIQGIQAIHAKKINQLLVLLNAMTSTQDLCAGFLRLHKLKGNRQNLYSITVQANWRITFEFNSGNVYIVDYLDYH